MGQCSTYGMPWLTTAVGFPLSFGIFQEYFRNSHSFPGTTQTPWIGVLSTGVPYLGAPVMTYLCQKYNFKLRLYVVVGWLLCVVGLVAAAFCRSVIALLFTQGLCYGVGLFIMDVPVLLILNTWFINRRGLAYGVLYGTTDLIGFGFSFLAQALLRKHGFKIALVIFAAIIFAVPGAAMFLLKERIPDPLPRRSKLSAGDLPQHPIPEGCCLANWHGSERIYYKRPIFYLLSTSNLIQAFGFYLPFIYLPSYAADLGYSATEGALVLAISNFAQIIGEVSFGKLSDKMPVRGLCVLGSSLVAAIATLTLWGLSHTLGQLVVFGVFFGAFASGLISLWARIGTFFGEKEAQAIFSVMSFGRGVGNIASGPISVALLENASPVDRHAYAVGKYQGIVLYVGGCMAFSALLGGVGFFAVKYEERTCKIETLAGSLARQDDERFEVVLADSKMA